MPLGISVEKRIDISHEVAAKLPLEVSRIVGKTAHDTYDFSQIEVPRDTNFLANSGQVNFVSGAQEGEVYYGASYAGYVHEGTTRTPANEFLLRAFQTVEPGIQAACRQLEARLR